MIMSPGIMVLLAVCVIAAAYALYAAVAGVRILAGWEAGSPAEPQLWRERKTCLLSAMLELILLADLLCLAVFVTLAERLHGLFTGAMCALGTLNANPYGTPAVLVMLAGVVLCVVWLAVNRLDDRAPNTTLVRLKYAALVPVALVLGAQAILVVTFFLRLNPAVITSCCAVYFNDEGPGIGSEVAHLSPALMQPLFWGTLAATLGAGLRPSRGARWPHTYAVLSAAMLPIGLAAIFSFLSVAIYELPTHHCPFCLLQREYGYAGYLLYAGLLLGAVPGMATGAVGWCGRRAGLSEEASRLAARLQSWSLAGYGLLGATAGRAVLPRGLLY